MNSADVFKSVLEELGFSDYQRGQMTNSDYWLCTTTAMERFADIKVKEALADRSETEEEIVEDDRDETSWEDEMESEEERRLETACNCSCGAWFISNKTGKAVHVADCICGAE